MLSRISQVLEKNILRQTPFLTWYFFLFTNQKSLLPAYAQENRLSFLVILAPQELAYPLGLQIMQMIKTRFFNSILL